MPKNIKLYISFCVLITIIIWLGILQVIVKHLIEEVIKSQEKYQAISGIITKKKSFNNFSKYKKRYHLINTEYINFPKEEKDSERRSNTLPFNLSKKKKITLPLTLPQQIWLMFATCLRHICNRKTSSSWQLLKSLAFRN